MNGQRGNLKRESNGKAGGKEKVKELINEAGRDPSAYARRRLALLLVGAKHYPEAVSYRNSFGVMHNFSYANCPDGVDWVSW